MSTSLLEAEIRAGLTSLREELVQTIVSQREDDRRRRDALKASLQTLEAAVTDMKQADDSENLESWTRLHNDVMALQIPEPCYECGPAQLIASSPPPAVNRLQQAFLQTPWVPIRQLLLEAGILEPSRTAEKARRRYALFWKAVEAGYPYLEAQRSMGTLILPMDVLWSIRALYYVDVLRALRLVDQHVLTGNLRFVDGRLWLAAAPELHDVISNAELDYHLVPYA
jgi:hypothetical protein